jgi:hypothetical protein
MKMNKTISTLALLGLAAGAQAQSLPPDTVGTAVFITGSTAFRSQIFAALEDLDLASAQGKTGSANSFTLYGTVSDNTGGHLNLSTNLTGTSWTAYCTFSGSAEGCSNIISDGSATYLTVTTANGTSFNWNGDDIAMSDVGQASTPVSPDVTGVTLPEAQLNSDTNFPEHTGVAVQPFVFVANKTASVITNITANNFQDLFHNGTLPLSFFTGNTTDSNTQVYAVGRYNLSGTRITSVLDNGTLTTVPLKQYALSPDGTSTPGLNSTDSATPAGTSWVAVGNGGYFTGGNVGLAINNSTATNASIPPAIAYIAPSDADSKITIGNATTVSIFGQNPGQLDSWNINGIINGSYTFWTYERMYVNPTDVGTPTATAFAPGLIQALQYEIAKSNPRTAVLESEMNVYRNSDGADVVHN